MTSIVFVVPSVLNKGAGERRMELDVSSIPDAFDKACGVLGDDFRRRVMEGGKPRSLINVYVNGKNAKFSGGLDMQLGEGDEVYALPAVAGGSDLSARDLDRYSRQVALGEIGYVGQQKLMSSVVCVVGAGGLGSPIITRLAAMGVGRLRIVDRDVVELSNLHRQTIYDESDVGSVKVEAAARHIRGMNSDCVVEPLAISINDVTAMEVVEGCDVVVDALDGVNARYALNRACVRFGVPFVTGAAVGVSGQVFTVVPNGACYNCMFPGLDEDEMPTCSIEGVHPAVLSVVGGLEVAEAIKVVLGQKPALSDMMLHVDIDTMDFATTRMFRADECPVCGSGADTKEETKELILEELCGRNRGKRTFAITPTGKTVLDADHVAVAAKGRGLSVENRGELGLSLRNNEYSVSFMKRGSAVVVGARDEDEAVSLYNELLGR